MNTFEIYAKELRIGDKVHCKMDGWLTVEKIDDTYMQSVYVTYSNGKEMHYYKEGKLFVIR